MKATILMTESSILDDKKRLGKK